ncbi:hypothetical protein B1H10_07685 [candidate division KSB1 bacterium 4484_188]|nr:MAG: hypothetical protein B1H10_07685 [candidate division KSB1 bacterium 4484_188]
MENTPGGSNRTSFDWNDWTKKDSEELVLMYLEDYYRTLDDYYLFLSLTSKPCPAIQRQIGFTLFRRSQ